jgi:hypothetical protein
MAGHIQHKMTKVCLHLPNTCRLCSRYHKTYLYKFDDENQGIHDHEMKHTQHQVFIAAKLTYQTNKKQNHRIDVIYGL